MRAALDPNVIISASLSRTGAPAELLVRWVAGEFDLIVSGLLLAELERALAYPKLRALVPEREAADFVDLLRRAASFRPDPVGPPARSDDPDDDYLLALAEQERALVVSGDRHLLALGDRFPVISPRAFLAELQASQGSE